MRLFEKPAGESERDKKLDLFEYPASTPWRVPPPKRSLLTRVSLASIPVLLVTVLLIMYVDDPAATTVAGIGQLLSPLIRLLLFIASGSFSFTSLILTFVIHQFFLVNRMVARHMVFVILAVAISLVASYVLNRVFSGLFPVDSFPPSLQAFNRFSSQLENGLFPASPAILMTALATAFFLLYPRFRLICLSMTLVIAGACILSETYHTSGVVFGVYLALLVTLIAKQGFEHWRGRF